MNSCLLIMIACGYVKKLRAVDNPVWQMTGRHLSTCVINSIYSNVQRKLIFIYPYALLDAFLLSFAPLLAFIISEPLDGSVKAQSLNSSLVPMARYVPESAY